MRNCFVVFLIALGLGATAFFLLRPVDKLQPNTSPTDFSSSDRYVEYSPASFAQASDRRRVLFFYAAWCPTCRPLDKELQANTGQIPEDVILFRTNYDTETELKTKYGVTYQHTFVQVDANGNAITSWNGGGMDTLLENIR